MSCNPTYNPEHKLMSAYPCDIAAAIALLQVVFLDYKRSPAFLGGGLHIYINIKRYMQNPYRCIFEIPEEERNGVWCCRFSHPPRIENLDSQLCFLFSSASVAFFPAKYLLRRTSLPASTKFPFSQMSGLFGRYCSRSRLCFLLRRQTLRAVPAVL